MENKKTPVAKFFLCFSHCFQNHLFYLRADKGGYLDFLHLTELKNVYITEIYMRKQYKSSKIKNKKNYKKIFFDGGSLKRLHSLLSYF